MKSHAKQIKNQFHEKFRENDFTKKYLISKSGSSGSPRVPSKVYKGKPRQIQALIPPELDVGGCVGCRGSVKFNFESINQNIQCLHYYHHTKYSMRLKQYKYFYKQTSQTIKCSWIGGRKGMLH